MDKKIRDIFPWQDEQSEVLDKQLRVKISDSNFERRFDDSFIIFKFMKNSFLVSSLNTKNVCENLVAYKNYLVPNYYPLRSTL